MKLKRKHGTYGNFIVNFELLIQAGNQVKRIFYAISTFIFSNAMLNFLFRNCAVSIDTFHERDTKICEQNLKEFRNFTLYELE